MNHATETAHCRFGSERFDVIADPAVCALFEREFADPEPAREPDVVFTIERRRQRDEEASVRGEAKTAGDCIRYANRYCDFDIRFGTPLRVQVALRRSRKMSLVNRLPVFAQRLATRKFHSVDEQEYGYLVYKAILWLLFLYNLRASRLFLHASGFVRNGRCVLLCGTGGVGKTSLSAKILAQKGTRFVSDDIVTVDPRGVAYANGMYVHAYPYNNLEASLPFQDERGAMAALNRAHWTLRKALLGSKGACRRISPFDLHRCGAAEVTGQPLDAIVWLSRDGSNESGLRQADAREFALSHRSVLHDEMRSAFDFYQAATGCGWAPQNDGMPVDLNQAVLDGLQTLTDHVPIWRFNVAENRSAAENTERLLEELETHTAAGDGQGSSREGDG